MSLVRLQSFSYVHLEATTPSSQFTCIHAWRETVPQHVAYQFFPVFWPFWVIAVSILGMCLHAFELVTLRLLAVVNASFLISTSGFLFGFWTRKTGPKTLLWLLLLLLLSVLYKSLRLSSYAAECNETLRTHSC